MRIVSRRIHVAKYVNFGNSRAIEVEFALFGGGADGEHEDDG